MTETVLLPTPPLPEAIAMALRKALADALVWTLPVLVAMTLVAYVLVGAVQLALLDETLNGLDPHASRSARATE